MSTRTTLVTPRMVRTLTLPLKAAYFYALKSGEKPEEFRLEGRTYDQIEFTLGYPRAGDTERRLIRPWRGYHETTITHPHFGPDPVKVFAIRAN